MSVEVIASPAAELKESLKEAADLISEALRETSALEIAAQIEAFAVLSEVLTEASCSFYILCSSADCQECFLSHDVIPAVMTLVDCAIKTLYVVRPCAVALAVVRLFDRAASRLLGPNRFASARS